MTDDQQARRERAERLEKEICGPVVNARGYLTEENRLAAIEAALAQEAARARTAALQEAIHLAESFRSRPHILDALGRALRATAYADRENAG